MSRVLAVANIKGGVGKTTTTANLAAALAERGCHVLVIDLDPQASLTFSLGVRTNASSKTISDVLDQHGSAIASIVQTTPEQIDLAPASHALNQVAHRLESTDTTLTRLRGALEPLRGKYDYILIDCPANAGIMTGIALAAADEVVIPLIPDALSFQALNWLLFIINQVREVANPTLRVAGLLLTMYDPRTRHAKEIIGTVHRLYGSEIPFYNAVVKYSVHLKEAAAVGKSILKFAPDSPAANAYRVLADEIEKGIHETPTNELYFVLVRGYEALRQKKSQIAYAEFCRASEMNPNLPQVWINRAYCAPTWDETMRSLARALQLEPQSAEVRTGMEQRLNEQVSNATETDISEMMAMARYLEEIDLARYADPLYRRVTELDTQHSEAWLGRARTTPNSADAVAEIRLRVETDPNNYAARAALSVAKDRQKADAGKLVDVGKELLQAGKRADARAKFEQAAELDSQNDGAWVGRARTAEDWHETSSFAEQALKINPENDDARLLYAATWDEGEPERLPVEWRQIARYMVPVLILVIALALVAIKLIIG